MRQPCGQNIGKVINSNTICQWDHFKLSPIELGPDVGQNNGEKSSFPSAYFHTFKIVSFANKKCVCSISLFSLPTLRSSNNFTFLALVKTWLEASMTRIKIRGKGRSPYLDLYNMKRTMKVHHLRRR